MEKSCIRGDRRLIGRTAAVLAAALLLFGAQAWPGPADVFAADSAAEAAAGILSGIGVMSPDSDGGYGLDRTVTRAEFAKMLVMASPDRDIASAVSASVFKDVPSSHWAARYIKPAVAAGLMSGYSDGCFRPSEPVTIEQAANSALKMLGYSSADFRGGFPHAQMSVFRNSGLSSGVSGDVGSLVSRGDAAKIVYNLLNTKTKDGSQKYAETIGYKLNAAGEIDYAAALGESMIGPVTAKGSSWKSEAGLSDGGFVVYRNGKQAAASDIKPYDIVYYNSARTTVWVYDKKITGVYERALPSQNDLSSVVVSGKEYAIESAAAFSALSSSGSLRTGSSVTLLIGRGGGVADAVAASSLSVDAVVYVTETGSKSYMNATGQEYSSSYIKGVSASGDEYEYPVTQSWAKKGDIAKISFSGGSIKLSKAGGSSIYGEADAGLLSIGQYKAAGDIRILDVYEGAYATVSMQRLDGARIDSGDVLYCAISGGLITSLILKDFTGDCASYGVATSVKIEGGTSTSGGGISSSSGEYTWLIDGASSSLSTQSGTYRISAGPVMLKGAASRPDAVYNLKRLEAKVGTFSETGLSCDGDVADWLVSEKVGVYTAGASGQYAHSTMDEALAAFERGEEVDFYYDDLPVSGGQIRVILIRY
ncbi:MAG: S-layer homology domain-containing protein [Clostridiales Family XIII bacterium]|jgi:hypothetical protein|nr:S-layer homology domain-containing protein [Clostridiales Family XIII bacterium]